MRIYHIPSSDISRSVDSISSILIGTAVSSSLLCADTSQILITKNVMTPLWEHQTIAKYRVSHRNTYSPLTKVHSPRSVPARDLQCSNISKPRMP